MSIQIHCPKCTSDFGVKHSHCPKCGTPVGKAKKFRVQVTNGKKNGGGRVTRIVEGSLTLAKTVEGKIKGQLAEGRYLDVIEETKNPKLSDVWDKYFAWSKSNKKSWKDDLSRWNVHLKEPFGNKLMGSISLIDIEQTLDRMRQGKTPYKPATVKNVHGLLRGLYNWAIERKLYTGINPAERIKLPKFDNKVTRYLEQGQIQTLNNVIEDFEKNDGSEEKYYATCVKFALYTGLRQSEITNLKWEDVDLKEMFVTIRDGKGVEINNLPLNAMALTVLLEAKNLYPEIESIYCFPAKDGSEKNWCHKYWKAIREAAKLPGNFRFHDLRHTYATYLASSGKVDLYTLQKLMTHKSPQMTQRYAHLMDETLKRGVDVAGDIFQNGGKLPHPD